MPKKSEIDFYNSFSPVYYIALGTSTCCQLKVFLPSKRKGFLQQTVDDELSANKCLMSTLIGVHIKRFDLKEKVRAFPRDK